METKIDLLPEIWREVFEYLSFEERQDASFVCKSWLELLDDYRFQKMVKVVFQNCRIDEKWPPVSTFVKSKRSFYHLEMKNINGPFDSEALEQCKYFGAKFETFTLINSRYTAYGPVAASFPKLTSLNLNCKIDFCNIEAKGVKVAICDENGIENSTESVQWLRSNVEALFIKTLQISRNPPQDLEEIWRYSWQLKKFTETFDVYGKGLQLQEVNLLEVSELGLEHITGINACLTMEKLKSMLNSPWNMTHIRSLIVNTDQNK